MSKFEQGGFMSGVEGVSALKNVEAFDPSSKKLNGYSIFKAHVDAIGGSYNVKNDKNYYTKGDIDMNHNMFEFEERGMKPLRNRLDIYQDGEIAYSSGDNGVWLWVKNGENISKFPDASAERNLNIARDELDYMNPDSDYFSIDSVKKKVVDGRQTYEIKVTNSMNSDENYYYYDAKTFMLNKDKYIRNGKTVETTYSDYKDVGGVKKAHKITTKNLSTNRYETKNIKEYKRNILMDKEVFDVPEKEDESLLNFNIA